MDELEKLAQEIPRLVGRARAAGESISDADLDAFVRRETGGRSGWNDVRERLAAPSLRNIARSVGQGALFNTVDELAGAISGKEATEESRFREQLYAAENPGKNFLGQLLGGFAVPGLGAARIAKGATTAGQVIRRGAAAGAATGAAAGAGAGEDPGERFVGALVGGGAGGVLGAAIPGAVAGARAVWSPGRQADEFARQLIRLEGHAQRSPGAAPLKDDEALRLGADRLRAKLAEYEAAGLGDDVLLGDLTEELRAQTNISANSVLKVRGELARILRPRAAAAKTRTLERA
jgi:hypothetical protein